MKKRILTPDELGEIKRLRDEGMSIINIAKTLGINKNILYRDAFKELGRESSEERHPAVKIELSQDEISQIINLYKTMGKKSISKLLNLSTHLVQRTIDELNIDKMSRDLTKPIVIPEKRFCKICKVDYSIDNFFSRIRRGRPNFDTICKECARKDRVKRTNARRINNPNSRLRDVVSSAIGKALKIQNTSKNGKSCLDYLSFNIDQLKNHIENLFEPWMNWGNQGHYTEKWDDNDPSTWKWQIDHIIPHSTFKYTSMEDQAFKDCWALSNLRPLSAKQNLLDGCSRVRHK